MGGNLKTRSGWATVKVFFLRINVWTSDSSVLATNSNLCWNLFKNITLINQREIKEAEASLQLKLGGCSGEKGSIKRLREGERDRRSNRWDMDERMRGWGGEGHILGLIDHFHLCLSCYRSVGMSQRIVCIQLPVCWTDHLQHRRALLQIEPNKSINQSINEFLSSKKSTSSSVQRTAWESQDKNYQVSLEY